MDRSQTQDRSITANIPVRQEFAAQPTAGPGVVVGFGTAVTMWILWYALHLPSVRVTPTLAAAVLLVALVGAVAVGTRGLGGRSTRVGLVAGLTAGLINLLLLGSKLTEAGDAPGEGSATLIPSAPLIVAGFLAVCVAAGGIGGWLGGALSATRRVGHGFWLARFSFIAVASLVPLITIGGAVTSSGAGMAVPDWPGTYGSNMFLYPIGLMADPYIFLEHTHRLFGTLVGLTVLSLTIAVLVSRGGWAWLLVTFPLAIGAFAATIANNADAIGPGLSIPILALISVLLLACALAAFIQRSTGGLAAAIFALVCTQGMLGALRVTEINPIFGVFHGVLAQLIFGAAVILAASLTQAWRARVSLPTETERAAKLSRGFAIATAACLLIQLTLAALYRHTGSTHALWTHIGFAIVVTIIVALLGFMLQQAERYSEAGRTMRWIGKALLVGVTFQFVLGFGAWAVAGQGGPARVVPTEAIGTVEGPAIGRTIIATIHQANGAFLLALTSLALGWAFRLGRSVPAGNPEKAGNPGASPALG